MNIQKFTQKSIEAVNNLEKIASDYGNQEIEQEHLLYALIHQEDSLIARIRPDEGQIPSGSEYRERKSEGDHGQSGSNL